MKMTTHIPPASLQRAAGAMQEPSLLRRDFGARMEGRRRKVARGIAEHPGDNERRMDNEFRLELERRLLGQ